MLFFCACSNPSGSGNEDNNKEYAIIFNWANYILNEQCALAVINPDGSGLRKIGYGIDPPQWFHVSVDGKKVVYVAYNIIIADIDSATTTTIFTDGTGRFPKISPNGEYVVYQQYIGNEIGLCVIQVDGTNKKLIIPGIFPDYYDWSKDSKGIYYADWGGLDYSDFFYIDRDGIDNPVKVESPLNNTKIVNALSEFDQSNLTFSDDRDSVSLNPYQVNKSGDKAWELLIRSVVDTISGIPWRKTISYLLGYDLNNMTVKILMDSNSVFSTSGISWSPNGEDLAVFAINGLEIIRFDGTENRILDYDGAEIHISQVACTWIPRPK